MICIKNIPALAVLKIGLSFGQPGLTWTNSIKMNQLYIVSRVEQTKAEKKQAKRLF